MRKFKGGGSSGPTETTVTQTDLPEYVQPYFERLLQRAEADSVQGYQPYGGQRLAYFSPDELTSLYLENYYGHQKNNRNLYIDGYAVQKKAEMQIGELLELYIQKEFFKYGWCCSGSTIDSLIGSVIM